MKYLLLILSLVAARPAFASTGRVEVAIPRNGKVVVVTIDGDAAQTLWERLAVRPRPSPTGERGVHVKQVNGVTCSKAGDGPHPLISCNFLMDPEAKIIPFNRPS